MTRDVILDLPPAGRRADREGTQIPTPPLEAAGPSLHHRCHGQVRTACFFSIGRSGDKLVQLCLGERLRLHHF